MLNQLLSLLGTKQVTKCTVGVSVSPLVGLELVQINPKTKAVLKYGCKPLEYDSSKREIANYDAFRETLSELFYELGIDKKSSIVISLPYVHYGLASLSTALGDAGINSALISEVEQNSYIFKRQDAVIGWIDAYPAGDKDNREILYGAIQQNAVDEIHAACTEIGCTLLAIESSHNSLLKTLEFNALAEEQMTQNTTWNLMVVNNNSYSMITLNDKSVIEYRDEPLALRSLSGDELYDAIISSAEITLKTTMSNQLYIVSETDMISAEVLSMKIPFDGNIKFLESNKYVQAPLMQASYDILPNILLKMTPEVIGAGLYTVSNFPCKFNLLGQKADDIKLPDEIPTLKIGDTEIELDSATVKKLSGIILAIVLLIGGAIFFGLTYLNNKFQTDLDGINSAIETNKAELEKYENVNKKDSFDEKTAVTHTQSLNRNKLIMYSALGLNIPDKTWIVYTRLHDNDKYDIIGRSTTVDNVYAFYKGLKLSVIDSNLRLSRLEMAENSIENLVVTNLNSIKPSFYEFEVTNYTDEELQQAFDEVNTEYDSEGKPKEKAENTPAHKRGFLFKGFLDLPETESTGTGSETSNENNITEPPKNLPANIESIENF